MDCGELKENHTYIVNQCPGPQEEGSCEVEMESNHSGQEETDEEECNFYEEDEDLVLMEDEDSSSSAPKFKGAASVPYFRILKVENVDKAREGKIREIANQLELSYNMALILLKHFQWNSEKLVEKYFDAPPDYFVEQGIPLPSTTGGEEGDFNPPPEKKMALAVMDCKSSNSVNHEEECNVCFDIFDCRSSRLACGHATCGECTFEYLKSRICGETRESMIRCPMTNCKLILSEDFIIQIIGKDEKVQKMYKKLSLDHFVMGHLSLKPCISPNCECYWEVDEFSLLGQASSLDDDLSEYEIICDCHENFCFYCAGPWHFPLNCKVSRAWCKEIKSDSGSSAWITTNTKKCPKCDSNIQKNGGCNVLICGNCKIEFCWICLRATKNHAVNHICRAQPDIPSTDRLKTEAYLERFIFASDRFQGHEHSYKLERILLDNSSQRMAEIREEGCLPSVSDVRWYQDAVKVLLECRRLLQYSFAFVFYLSKNSNVEIFEMNMNNLHQSVETLSGYLESGVSAQELGLNKQKVMNLSTFCRSRKERLIQHVNEGYRDQSWTFSFQNDKY